MTDFQDALRANCWQYKDGAWWHPRSDSRYATTLELVLRITPTHVYRLSHEDMERGPIKPEKK